MRIEVDKLDLINLIEGMEMLIYDFIDHPLVSSLCEYDDEEDIWDWDYLALEESTEEQLYNIYKLLKYR